LRRERATHNPRDICVDERGAPFVGERRDCAGSILADTGQLAEAPGVFRQSLVMHASRAGYFTREAVQVAGACVITQPLPRFSHLSGPGPRKVAECGKAVEEALVVTDDARDLCLLQHQLGNEHPIWVARFAPGKIASVASIPCAQAPTEFTVVLALLFPGH
jgi:hypothetical protein